MYGLPALTLTLLLLSAPAMAAPEGRTDQQGQEKSPSPKLPAPMQCELMLKSSWQMEQAANILHKRLTAHPHLALFAQGNTKLFSALGLEELDASDFPGLQMHVRENLPRPGHTPDDESDYIVSFHLGTERDAVAEIGFNLPPIFAWLTYHGSKQEFEKHLKQKGLVFPEIRPDSIANRPLGVRLNSRNEIPLYLTYLGTSQDGQAFIEIGAYLPCRSSNLAKALDDIGLVRQNDGYICRVPILVYY